MTKTPQNTRWEFKFFFIITNKWKIRKVPSILGSNPHPFHSFGGLKNHMWIRTACGLDSQSRAGFWKNDRAAVCAVRIQ